MTHFQMLKHHFTLQICLFKCSLFTILLFFEVLVSEGYKSPFIGIMKSGECHVLRQVDVLESLPNGKRVSEHNYCSVLRIFENQFHIISQ